jgi:hypothetical protein
MLKCTLVETMLSSMSAAENFLIGNIAEQESKGQTVDLRMVQLLSTIQLAHEEIKSDYDYARATT